MQSKHASKVFEALSSGCVLRLVQAVGENAPDGLVQGDIAKLLDIPSTNLSFHLKAIVKVLGGRGKRGTLYALQRISR